MVKSADDEPVTEAQDVEELDRVIDLDVDGVAEVEGDAVEDCVVRDERDSEWIELGVRLGLVDFEARDDTLVLPLCVDDADSESSADTVCAVDVDAVDVLEIRDVTEDDAVIIDVGELEVVALLDVVDDFEDSAERLVHALDVAEEDG